MAKKVAAATPEVEEEAARLEQEIDEETTAPEGVKVEKKSKKNSSESVEIIEEEGEDDSVVRRLARPTGKFVSIGNEIFNGRGQLVGTETDASVAARKVDRFNSQVKNG